MPTPIYLVKVGMNMTEGVVEEWYVPDGGSVEKDELLYRLETEKVNLDVDADAAGIVKHLVAEGVTLKPGDVVGYIYAAGEDIPEDAGAAPTAAGATDVADPEPSPAAAVSRSPADDTPSAGSTGIGGRLLTSPAARRLAGELDVDIRGIAGSGPGGRIVEADVRAAAQRQEQPRTAPSSPIARKLARELEVDLQVVRGTGPGGRITREDVEAAAAAGRAAEAGRDAGSGRRETAGADRTIPLSGMRRTIARRMHDSLQTMAQLTMDMDVLMDEAVKLRSQLNEAWASDGVRLGYTDLVIAATARALREHPHMNAALGDAGITLRGDVHLGMAVALEDGLIVPVIRHADTLSLGELARETARLATAARDGDIGVDDLADGTFTVTALGMFGVDAFTPIVNAPQVGILGVNRLREAVGWDGDVPVKQQRMNLSLTWDHRALDGAPAARFLASVRQLLEAPLRLLL
ncbi:MAG: dihydrolipoamide acetyltransferase [Gammaproteobacteria bacterium]|nr:dihydrolipoamide acetyltransferase [Gammaproteobacteria bacterium]|tara:strand:- start:15 stop:1406 length:1392 start_codon:yes stop_codon:yes gene_type:complete